MEKQKAILRKLKRGFSRSQKNEGAKNEESLLLLLLLLLLLKNVFYAFVLIDSSFSYRRFFYVHIFKLYIYIYNIFINSCIIREFFIAIIIFCMERG